ncbi:hypothetical protein V3C99_018851, partial [Haemonchus contortus]
QYDPYSDFSYVELNKRRRGDIERRNSEKIENRYGQPAVKKIYVKANGDPRSKKAKLFIWRKWQSPTLAGLRADVAPYVGLEMASAIYDIRGKRVTSEDDIRDYGTYYVVGDEELLIPDSDDDYEEELYQEPATRGGRVTSMSAPEMMASRQSLYDNNQKRYRTRNNDSRFDDRYTKRNSTRYYEDDDDERLQNPRVIDGYQSNDDRYRSRYRSTLTSRSRSANDDYRNDDFVSDFDNDASKRRDKEALARHRQRYLNVPRSSSEVIYNRRDQTHPDAYIIYVFLNGQGMECQHMHFQKKQLAKGMNYVLELIARRFNVNPMKLCDMDGRKITEPSQLMSRGAYVLVAAGQSFRDTWYFLPDNAIDTRSQRKITEPSQLMSRGAYVLVAAGQSFRDTWYFLPDNAIDTSTNQERVEDRMDQRDRLLQRRERRERAKLKSQKAVTKTEKTSTDRYRLETVQPGRRFGNTYN